MSTPLTGPELLKKVEELGDVNKSEKVRATGYVTTDATGKERLNFTGFYDALLAAKGFEIDQKLAKRKADKRRQLSFSTTVLKTGHAVIGQRYLEQLGAGPGDVLTISLVRKQLRLEIAAKGATIPASISGLTGAAIEPEPAPVG